MAGGVGGRAGLGDCGGYMLVTTETHEPTNQRERVLMAQWCAHRREPRYYHMKTVDLFMYRTLQQATEQASWQQPR